MVIYTRKKNKKPILNQEKAINKPVVVKEEIKEIKTPVNNEVVYKKKNNKKSTPTPVVEKPMEEVVEEEKIDLSEWLKEDNEE